MAIINSIVSGFTIAIIATTSNIINLGLEKMGDAMNIIIIFSITLLCGFILSIICFEFLYFINKKRQRAIDIKYSDSDK